MSVTWPRLGWRADRSKAGPDQPEKYQRHEQASNQQNHYQVNNGRRGYVGNTLLLVCAQDSLGGLPCTTDEARILD